MSALTKVFVVLLVILSLLLAAASVTFLNTIPNYETQLAEQQALVEAARARGSATERTLQAEVSRLRDQQAPLTQQLNQTQAQVQQLRADLAEAEAQQAASETQLAQAQATVSTSNQALLANQALLDELSTQVAALRDENNNVLQQFAQTSSRLAQAENERIYAERALRAAQEQNVDASTQIDQLRRAVAALGGNPDEVGPAIFPPSISGVIVDRTTISNEPYASISVGREDDVLPGMEFIVIDQESGSFVGFLTVQQVDDSQAFGKLTGDNVGSISSGDQVRTQLSS